MKTLSYAGANLRVSDALAHALQRYLVVLRFSTIPATWLAIPCYADGSDTETIASVQLVANVPIVIVPAYPALPDASGSLEATAELNKWSDQFGENHGNDLDEASESDERLVKPNG